MSDKNVEFKTFCLNQTMRLEALGAFPFGDSSIIEIRNFLQERADGDESKVKAVIEECLELDQRPTLPDIRRVWMRIHNPDTSHAGCALCVGAGHAIGWITTVAHDKHGVEVTGVKRCPCGSYQPREYLAPKDNPAGESLRNLKPAGEILA